MLPDIEITIRADAQGNVSAQSNWQGPVFVLAGLLEQVKYAYLAKHHAQTQEAQAQQNGHAPKIAVPLMQVPKDLRQRS